MDRRQRAIAGNRIKCKISTTSDVNCNQVGKRHETHVVHLTIVWIRAGYREWKSLVKSNQTWKTIELSCNSQYSFTRTWEISTGSATWSAASTSTVARIAWTSISRARLFLCMTEESLLWVAHLNWNCSPFVLAKHTSSERLAIRHAHVTGRLSCTTRIHISRCDLICWRSRIDYTSPEVGVIRWRDYQRWLTRLTFNLRIIMATWSHRNQIKFSTFLIYIYSDALSLTSRNTETERRTNAINLTRSILHENFKQTDKTLPPLLSIYILPYRRNGLLNDDVFSRHRWMSVHWLIGPSVISLTMKQCASLFFHVIVSNRKNHWKLASRSNSIGYWLEMGNF